MGTFVQISEVTNKIAEILGNDSQIQRLLFYPNDTDSTKANPSLEQLISSHYINTYPVFLQADDRNTFISIHADNTVFEGNVSVTTYKVSCGVSLDAWNTASGSIRVYDIADRIKDLIDGKKICNSLGELNLSATSNAYWNGFVTGIVMIFQMYETGDIHESIL